MARMLLLLIAFMMAATAVTAQIQMNYQISPANATRAIRPVDLGGGNTLYACERAFGWDSSYVELLFTAPDHTVIDAVAYRMATPLTFLYNASALDDGFLLCGLSYGDFPFVMKTSVTGAVQWYSWMDNLPALAFHDQVVRVVPRGTDFTAYTARGGMYSPYVYRLEGTSTGTGWSGVAITAPTGIQVRVYEALRTTDPMVHLTAGSGYDNADPQNMKAMVMRTSGIGSDWMKLYDMAPSATSQTEDVYSLCPTLDGNYLCAGYVTTGPATFEGFIMKIDALGAVIWCQRYSDTSGGLLLSAVTELPGGDLLVAGEDAYYQGMVLNLSSTGGLIQARRYQPGGGGIELTDDFFANTLGELKLMTQDKAITFSSGGASCDFVDVGTVSASVYAPTVTTHLMTNTPFTPTTQSMNTFPRTPALSWSQTCVISGVVEEELPGSELIAYPVPSNGRVFLKGRIPIARSERVLVRDLAGAVVREARYEDGLDLRDLATGAYLLEIPERHMRVLVMME